MHRSDLDKWLNQTFLYADFDDYCFNGLQVEGGKEIKSIGFAVSFNQLLAEQAVNLNLDALIVHHGFFGKHFLSFQGPLKKKILTLLSKDISLFGIHLPLDAHAELGNNAVLLSWLGAKDLSPLNVGYIADNAAKHTVNTMLNILATELGGLNDSNPISSNSKLMGNHIEGSDAWLYGPEIPKKIACISGGASSMIEEAAEAGADTFITGEAKEHIPSLAMDLGINFINLGHYRSEKAGILALMHKIQSEFSIDCTFLDIPNRL